MIYFALGYYFTTGPVVVPVVLLVLLVVGVLAPVYDVIKLRRKAKKEGTPMPGLPLLFRELSESQLLAYAISGIGIFLMIIGAIVAATARGSIITTGEGIGIFALGIALGIASQKMIKKFHVRMRSWRKQKIIPRK